MRNFVTYRTYLFFLLLIPLALHSGESNSFLIQKDTIYSLFRKESVLYQKSITVMNDSLCIAERVVTEWDLNRWADTSSVILPYDSILFHTPFDFTGTKITFSLKEELFFFSPGRFMKVSYFQSPHHNSDTTWHQGSSFHVWKTFQSDSLHFIALYDTYNDYKKEKTGKVELSNFGFCIPLKNGDFYTPFGKTMHMEEYENFPHTIPITSRHDMYDTDTVQINGKYGLFTFFGEEVLPAIYDSMGVAKYGYFATTYKGDSISLMNYLGKPIKENLKIVTELTKSFQVLDKDNRMLYLDSYGNEIDEGLDGRILTGDEILAIHPATHLLKKKKNVRKVDCWVKVEFCWYCDLSEYSEFLSYKKYLEDNGIKHKTWREFNEMVNEYGLEDDVLKGHLHKAFKEYIVEVYPIPTGYKDTKLVNNSDILYFSSDYYQLPEGLLIARKRGKYGVLNIYEPEKPVLPFTYKRITGVINQWHQHLLVEKKGLKGYYPLSSEPRYKKLERFQHNFARFKLPDGRTGWLCIDGKEFFD